MALDPAPLIGAMQSKLHLHSETRTPTSQPAGDGTLYYQHFSSNSGKKLLIYTLYWEPISTKFKKSYLGYDESNPGRLPFDQAAKNELMYDRVADVVIYVGVGKRKIQESVVESLKFMQQDAEKTGAKDDNYSYFFVTWSLGSKIVVDCLSGTNLASPRTDDEGKLLHGIVGHTDSIFMLANQLSLLSMAATHPATQPSEVIKAPSLHNFIAERNSAATSQKKPRPRMSIVAVSDPNDLLSFPIPDWFKQQENDSVDVTNANISVAHWALYIPYILGGGRTIDPLEAHTGYGQNDAVIRLIIEGHKSGE